MIYQIFFLELDLLFLNNFPILYNLGICYPFFGESNFTYHFL